MIHRRALAKVTQVHVRAAQFGNVPLAPEHGRRVPIFVCLGDDAVEVAAHLGIGLVVAIDHLLRLGHRNMQGLTQTKRLLPVDDSEVDRLGATAHLGRHLVNRHAKDVRGRMGVEVLPAQERIDKTLVSRKMREQPELDLRVVSREEHAAFRRDEGLADAAAELGAHGNVLQVGIG